MKYEKQALDTFELEFMPMEMKAYLRNNGWNFNKKACEYAVKLMKKMNNSTKKLEPIEPYTKEQVDAMVGAVNQILDSLINDVDTEAIEVSLNNILNEK